MNSRANTAMFIVLLLLFGIFTGVSGYYLGYNRLIPRLSFIPLGPTPTPSQVRVGGAAATPPPTSTPTPSISPSPTPVPSPKVDPKTTVDTFMKDFIASAPPKNDANAASSAKNLLSVDALTAINQENASSFAGGIAKFTSVQNVPMGYSVGNATINADNAIVPTNWDFLNGSVKKVFYLINQNNVWKIDTIRDQ